MTDTNQNVQEEEKDTATPVADTVIDTTVPAADNKAVESSTETKPEEVKKA